MPAQDVPLLDELVSALAMVREEICRIRTQGNQVEPDPFVLDAAQAAITRYELERDRSDLDSATLPVRIVMSLQDNAITSMITDNQRPIELVTVNYDVPPICDARTLVAVPQPSGPPIPAMGRIDLIPRNPEFTGRIHQAVLRGTSNDSFTSH